METSCFISRLATPPHSSWQDFTASPQVLRLLADAESAIALSGKPVTPAQDAALRFLQTDLLSAKVIILGQDPYPQAGAATGRCFEVGTLQSWEDTFPNISLKNIVRSLYHAETGQILTYKQILAKAVQGWPLLPPQLLFQDWEAQGVLLLNTAFTCELGAAGSHAELWRPFTQQLLRYICSANPHLIWFVWGKHAEKHTADLPIQHKLVSQHPMMCYEGEGRTDDFLFGQINMFKETAHLVHWTGKHARGQSQNLYGKGLFY